MKIKTNGWLFAQQKSTNFQSIWTKEKTPLKASELTNLQASPSYFQKRTKTFKRLVKRYYYIADNTLYYCEKQKSTQIKGMLDLSQVYAEFYESKVKILKNNTYIICLRQDASFVELLTENKQIFNEWSAVLRRCCIMLDFHNQFNILKMIGKGGFSRVFLAQDKFSRENYAIKVITKDKLLQQSKGIKSLLNEIQIMRDLQDANGCLKLIGVYETDSSVNLILEYVKGGELVRRIKMRDKNNFTIENVRQLMQNILIALAHIHQRKIIHRDLKPDNILIDDDLNSNKIKIADFGLATYDSSILNDFLFKKCGTPGFLAPEVLSNKEPHKLYDQKVDVFSAGVILYILLSGQQPFKGSNHRQVVDQNKKCDIDFSILDQNQKIPQAVKQMLTKDPLSRPTSQECLNSVFFKENYQNNPLNIDLNNYESYKLQSLDGLNKIKISSLDRTSHNDLYWINPIWKGQTSTVQTVTKLSSIYLQINEVRKRNKSNFAPNTQNPQAENEESPLLASVREKRSASADCDFRNKFFNQSLHIAVLKKNKQGEEQTNSNNPQVSIDNNYVVIEEDQQSDQTSTHENPHQPVTLPKSIENNPPQNTHSQQAQIPLAFIDGNIRVSIFKRNHHQTLEIPVEEYKISFKSSGGESIENEPEINKLSNAQTFELPQKNNNANYSQKQQQNTMTQREQQDTLQSDIILDERGQYDEDCRNKQYSNRSIEYNLKRSEAIENHCQKVNHIAIRFRDTNSYNNKLDKILQQCPHQSIITPNSNTNTNNTDNQENIEDSQHFQRQGKSSNSYIQNSCQEADFRVSEVEENISSRHQAINRNLIFRYNPFDQDIYL